MSNVHPVQESTNATEAQKNASEKFSREKSRTKYKADRSDELESEYQFYRSLVKMNIFKMTNSKGR